jgi:hypothetical protein
MADCSIMLVFIDESGDPGFRVNRGSTPIFVAAMVIFNTRDDALATERTIRAAADRMRLKSVFKFNKSNGRIRDEFFRTIRQCPFMVRAIVVQKKLIYSPHLKTDKDNFYRFFVRQMLTHDSGLLDGARIVIDGSGDRVFRQTLAKSYGDKQGRG